MFGWFKCPKDADLHAKLDALAENERFHYLTLRRLIMATKEEFEAGFARVDAATTGIANVIRELIAKIEAGGMTAEEEAAVLARLGQSADALEAMAVTPEDPVPVDPPV
jgi:hypothetical protein